MKVRVVFDLNMGTKDMHPNYAARVVDAALQRIAQTNRDLLSWETVDAQEVQSEVR
jgi:hypothetical protein